MKIACDLPMFGSSPEALLSYAQRTVGAFKKVIIYGENATYKPLSGTFAVINIKRHAGEYVCHVNRVWNR